MTRTRRKTVTLVHKNAALLATITTFSAAVLCAPSAALAQATGASFSGTGPVVGLRGRTVLPDPRRPEPRNEDEEVLRRNYWTYRSVTAIRLNPLGLFSDVRFSYRSRLYQNLDTVFRDAFVAFTPVATVSPAWGRVGAFAEVQPLALLNLSAGAEFIGMMGTFDTVQSWDSPQARASDRDQDVGGANRWSYSTTGFQLTFGAAFQIRLANAIVLRTNARAFYSQLNTRVPEAGQRAADPMNAMSNAADRRGTSVWYDILQDTVVPTRGWFAHIDSDLLFAPEGAGLNIGVRHSYTQAFFGKSDFQNTDFCASATGGIGVRGSATDGCGAGNFFDPNGPMHRIGPLIAYNIRESYHARFNAPTVFLAVQWWVSHRYRTGDRSAQETMLGNSTAAADYVASAMPYLALGFSFRGDLLYPRR
jgi:hypothetical protein